MQLRLLVGKVTQKGNKNADAGGESAGGVSQLGIDENKTTMRIRAR
jgi:hypothetical protein